MTTLDTHDDRAIAAPERTPKDGDGSKTPDG